MNIRVHFWSVVIEKKIHCDISLLHYSVMKFICLCGQVGLGFGLIYGA
jgi:hypothetical protein